MGVQSVATARNSQVEYFIHFILDRFFSNLEELGRISSYEIELQKSYSSDIASDVWDHFISATNSDGRRLEIWGQTTCYKGNGTGKPESNKTYEVRETLVEGLSIREHFNADPEVDCRSIHFTVGDSRYTYQWFMCLKEAVFDLSIYVGEPGYDIFADIGSSLVDTVTEDAMFDALSKQIGSGSSMSAHINSAFEKLLEWWDQEYPVSPVSDDQWNIVKQELEAKASKWPNFDSITGQNIKGRVNDAVFSEDPDLSDPLITQTTAKLLSRNPFLAVAIQALSSWDEFSSTMFSPASADETVDQYLQRLWSSPLPYRHIVRRLLVRIHSKESVSYIQDRDVEGVTEHNMYSGEHSSQQTKEICAQILQNLASEGMASATDISSSLARRGKALLNQARWFEAKNGSQLKPSFDYVILALEKAGFSVCKPQEAGIRPIGYHSEISSETVRPYTNLKAVLTPSGDLACLLKAKFFREQEFPRRCKEEAFVGLTLKYHLTDSGFTNRFDVPLIMFVDMADDFSPPPYAIRKWAGPESL